MKRILKKKTILVIATSLLFFTAVPQIVSAATNVQPGTYEGSDMQTQLNAFSGENGAKFGNATDPRIVVARLIKISLGIVGTLAFALAAYAGFLMMTSQGNEEKIEVGKKIMVYCVTGVAVMLGAYSIVYFVYVGIFNSFENPMTPGCSGGVYVLPNNPDLYNPDQLQENTTQTGYQGSSMEWQCN